MDALERFKKITEDNRGEDELIKSYCVELEEHSRKMNFHYGKIQSCLELILNELEGEYDSDSLYGEGLELPVEDYKMIREKFGEEVANRIYYDVKLKRVPLRFVQGALRNYFTEE